MNYNFYRTPKQNAGEFYQSKYLAYRSVGVGSALLVVMANMMYFFTDCQLVGGFSTQTFIPRFSILIPGILCIIANKKTVNYKIMMFFLYLIAHGAMWSTIWSIVYLPNRDFAREGFIIFHFAFLAIGLCAPFKYSTVIHSCFLLNLIVSNLFIHYQTFNMMITLAVPVWLGICCMQYVLEASYWQRYLAEKQLQTLSVTDQLTGLYNRNGLHKLLKPGTSSFAQEVGKISYVMIMDIDLFKNVNDAYGHEAGDKILKYVAQELYSNTRANDYVIRWGGEEFVVLVADADQEMTMHIANRIRDSIQNGDNGVCPVTMSIGVAPYGGDDYHVAISNADKALYTAKNKGRNNVQLYEG